MPYIAPAAYRAQSVNASWRRAVLEKSSTDLLFCFFIMAEPTFAHKRSKSQLSDYEYEG